MIDCYIPLANAVRTSPDPQKGNANDCQAVTTTGPIVAASSDPQRLIQRKFCKAIASREVVSLEQVQSFLERGANLNQPTTLGDIRDGLPLHWAAIAGNGQAVEALIASGQVNDIDAKYDDYFTPLALICGARSDVRLPLFPWEMPPPRAREAEQSSRNKGLKALLDGGANPKLHNHQQRTPLHHAAENNWPELLLTLTGDNPKPDTLNPRDASQNTPLHRAAANGHYDSVRVLLKQGAAPNLPNVSGETALHRLCLSARDDPYNQTSTTTKTAMLLLDYGADPNQMDQKAKRTPATPIDHAKRLGKVNLVDALTSRSGCPAGKSSLLPPSQPATTEVVRERQEDRP